MPNKNIGFNRTIHRAWLDAAATLRLQTDDPQQIRTQLVPIVSEHLTGTDAKRKTIDIIINIWHKTAELSPAIHEKALSLYKNAFSSDDHLWLHYGLTLLYYPIFREITLAIGQLARMENTLTRDTLKQRMVSSMGDLGSLDRSVERICASLTDWGILPAINRSTYQPVRQAFSASSPDFEVWMLTCALSAHPAEEIPYADLIRLPELFPFNFTIGIDQLRNQSGFTIQRQGIGWEMVRFNG